MAAGLVDWHGLTRWLCLPASCLLGFESVFPILSAGLLGRHRGARSFTNSAARPPQRWLVTLAFIAACDGAKNILSDDASPIPTCSFRLLPPPPPAPYVWFYSGKAELKAILGEHKLPEDVINKLLAWKAA